MAKQKIWDGTQWVQIGVNPNDIGTLSTLSTNEKTNLVGAINELHSDAETYKSDNLNYQANTQYLRVRGVRYNG